MFIKNAAVINSFLMPFQISYGKKTRFKVELILDVDSGAHYAAINTESMRNFYSGWMFDFGEDLMEECEALHRDMKRFLTEKGYAPTEPFHSVQTDLLRLGDMGYKV